LEFFETLIGCAVKAHDRLKQEESKKSATRKPPNHVTDTSQTSQVGNQPDEKTNESSSSKAHVIDRKIESSTFGQEFNKQG
jgi:hypothetical protein